MPADTLTDAQPPDTAPHRLAAAEIAARLQVDLAQGLSATEALHRLEQQGLNLIDTERPAGLLRQVARQFASLMVGVLLAAAAVAAAMGEVLNAAVILVIVLLNAAIGAAQAWRADRALRALQDLVTPQATVRRDGQVQSVATVDLVAGDLVLLSAGESVPADLRLTEVQRLRIDESTLTGESVGVDKSATALPAPDGRDEPALGDRINLAYKGTLVTQGRGVGVVVATGARTELGRIATQLSAAPERSTPLQRRLATLARQLALAVLAICAAIFALGLWRGEPLGLMALTAISLAVAAMPEALPAVVAVLLAFGARRMARAHALVRRLPAVETLGAVDRVCADKTGTLTLNRMSVACALTALGDEITVPLRAWHDADDDDALPDAPDAPGSRTASVALWRAALLCNDAQAYPASPDNDAVLWQGDPTETALLEGAQAVGLHVRRWRQRLQRQHEWPFDAERRRMSTLHRSSAGWLLVCKGAPETVLPRCHTYQQVADDAQLSLRRAWQARADALAAQGLRVLAVAQRRWAPSPAGTAPPRPFELDANAAEDALELLGLIGLIDPPRPEAAAAVAQCRSAGITPVMITGDHPATALAIARALGIVAGAGDAPADEARRVLTGAQLARLSDAEFDAAVEPVRVFARVDPAQKIRIVQALQARGHVVAMTGDGVNDAPALKAADIGVAMGRGGTDVAREAADLVLLDDHFATIVAAVREGRRIVDNIRRFLRYALTGNSGELWTLVLAPLLGLPLPLVPVQILWINLITDGLPGLALAAEPAEPGVMQRPPRRPDQGLLDGGLWQHALGVGLLIGLLCVALQAWAMQGGHPGQTLVFAALTLCQLGHALAIRSDTVPLWRLNPLRNRSLAGAVAVSAVLLGAVIYLPPLQALFQTQPLSLGELGLCLACAAVVVAAVEVEKAVRRHRHH